MLTEVSNVGENIENGDDADSERPGDTDSPLRVLDFGESVVHIRKSDV